MQSVDLHTHSTVSDGLLAPAELARRAHRNQADLWALTDHDELGGVNEARTTADELGLRFVAGVEISVSWTDDLPIHVLGLNVDEHNSALQHGLAVVREGRDARAHRIADELLRFGVEDAYQGALKHAGNPSLISRSHFARYLAEKGFATDIHSVFDNWLAQGKRGYVEHAWATLPDALEWIHNSGGVSVLAHPGRYRLSASGLRKLVEKFKELGGMGIEVISGSQSMEATRVCASLARRFELMASCGSDYHGPGESWIDLGKVPQLPDGLQPVWNSFR